MIRKLASTITAITAAAVLVIAGAGIDAQAAATKNPVSIADTNAIILNDMTKEYVIDEDSTLLIDWNSLITGVGPSAMSDSRGDVWTYSYGANGKLQSFTHNVNSGDFTWLTAQEYDAANRITAKALTVLNDDGSPDLEFMSLTSYQYTIKSGKVTKIVRSGELSPVTSTVSYDKLGRVSKISSYYMAEDEKVPYINSYTYKNGYVIKMTTTFPEDGYASVTNITYDANGNIASVTDDFSTLQIVYDAAGRLAQTVDSSFYVPYTRSYVY